MLVVALVFLVAQRSLLAVENEGQAKLDAAIDAKLSAESINQLGEVINLANQALEEGLDEDNSAFAKQLLASTLIQRGTAYAELLLNGSPSQIQTPRQFRQLRALALGDLKDAVEIDPQQPEAWFAIGRLESLPGGDRDAARQAYDRALGLNPEDRLLRARVLAGRATLLDDPEKQLADLNEAAKLSPDQVEVLRARGMLLLEQGRFDEAHADLQKLVELEPDDPLNQLALASLLADQKKYDEALPHFDKAIELAPGSAQLYNQRARANLLAGKAAQALEDLDKTLEIEPRQPMALLLRANALLVLGDAERALTDVERVLKEDNDFAPALRMRGMLLARSGKMQEAAESLRDAAEATPDDVELRLQLATVELANKKPDVAVKEFTAVIEADPDNWIALQGRGDAYLSQGDHQRARDDYEAALQLEANNSTILNNLAWLLATSTFDELRNGPRAIELAQRACEVTNFKAAHILSTLAAAYAETGDFDKAIEWSTKAVEQGDARQKPQLAKELECYKEHKPWRELVAEPLPEDEDSQSQNAAPQSESDGERKTAAKNSAVEEKEPER
jgi:tetratricopeptide (TPR) repeat protein